MIKNFAFWISLSVTFFVFFGSQAVAQKESKELTTEELESYKNEAKLLINYLEQVFNMIGSKETTPKEKDIIINESYLKIFENAKVQIEDDLVEKREVLLNKDVQAYLKDIEFFYKNVKFNFEIQEITHSINEKNQVYLLVTMNRNLAGRNIKKDTINTNKVRYVEINIDDENKEIKIASIYTIKLNEDEDLQNWWNKMPQKWKTFFGKEIAINDTLFLSDITNFNDSIILTGTDTLRIDSEILNKKLKKVSEMQELSLAGNQFFEDFSPLSKLTELTKLDLSNTKIKNLKPIRNLTKIKELNISRSWVSDISALRYSTNIKKFDISSTQVSAIDVLRNFSNMEDFSCENTRVKQLSGLEEVAGLKILNCNHTLIDNLAEISKITSLEKLRCAGTQIVDLSPIKKLQNLQEIHLEKTSIADIEPLLGLKKLKWIYCDSSNVTKSEANKFMTKRQDCLVMNRTKELREWWKTMSGNWRKIFVAEYKRGYIPTKIELHKAVLLDSINVKNKKLLDIHALSKLEKLRFLDISGTSFVSLDGLKNNTKLEFLYCGNNPKLNTLEALQNMTKLQILNCENTTVNDISEIQRLENLQKLYLDNTSVKEEQIREFMLKHPNCIVVYQTQKLEMWWKNKDTKPWKPIINKQIETGKKPSKEELHQISNIEILRVTKENKPKKIKNLNPLKIFWKLKQLNIEGTSVANLDPIRNFRYLTDLNCSSTQISNLSALQKLSNLKTLNCSNTQIDNLEYLKTLKKLEDLDCSGTKVKSLKGVESLKNLKVLNISSTKVGNLRAVREIKKLKTLKCFNTKIWKTQITSYKKEFRKVEVVYY